MNTLKVISIIFLGTVSTYIIKNIYEKRYNFLFKLVKYGSIVKKKICQTKKKKTQNKNIFMPTQLIIDGAYIKYKNMNINNLNFEKNIKNVSYYTGMINFILTYKFNNEEYFFIRKNFLLNCVKDLKEFINDLIENNNYKKSRILNAEIVVVENNNNNIIKKDITTLVKKVEGFNKDFNLECVYIRDLYFFLNEEINLEINEDNEETIKITIIDNEADEHLFRYNDKLNF